jgi:hypothetical protein
MVVFDRTMLAPCGINCGTCIGYLRTRNKCCGCWPDSGSKPPHCSLCAIKNCEHLKVTDSKFCYDCDIFPCRRLKQLDKRYKTKYHMSMLQNLAAIKDIGVENYLDRETTRWSCPGCGSVISVHRENCINCNIDLNKKSL